MLTRTGLMLLILATCAGCHWLPRHSNGRFDTPVAFHAPPTAEQLIGRINQQSSQVDQLQAHVRVAMDGLPALSGNLTVERPRRMRLNASLLGFSEMGVDVGSNDYAFWIWSRYSGPGHSPVLYFARHEDYQRSSIRQALAIEPQWVIDAIGLVELDPAHLVGGPISRPDGRVELHFSEPSPTGAMTRVVVVDPRYGWINQQAMYDPSGRLRAHVNAVKHQFYPDVQVSLPQHLVLTVYGPEGQQATLTMTANRYTVNALYGDPEVLWAMPNPAGVQRVDLSQVEAMPAGAMPWAPPDGSISNPPSQPGQRPFQALRDRARIWR